jgi:hypothetical protein
MIGDEAPVRGVFLPRALITQVEGGHVVLEHVGDGDRQLTDLCREIGVVREPLSARRLVVRVAANVGHAAASGWSRSR